MLILVDREALLKELQQAFPTQQAETVINVVDQALDKAAAQLRAESITRQDFSELKQIVADLAEAQKQTAISVDTLTARLDTLTARVDALTARVDALTANVQALTARVDALTANVQALTARVDALTARVDDLTARLDTLTARVDALTARVDDLTVRLDTLTARVDALTARVDALTVDVQALTAAFQSAQKRNEERFDRLEAQQQELINDVAKLKGDSLENRYRTKATSYFGQFLRKTKVVDIGEILDVLDERLPAETVKDVLQLDLLVRGKPFAYAQISELWLAVEVSSVVDANDVLRAQRRATALRQAGYATIPVVAGDAFTRKAGEDARQHNVLILQDGQSALWDEAMATWIELHNDKQAKNGS